MTGSLADARTQTGAAKTVADILTAAADLIEPEGRWTTGAFARTVKGRVIGSSEAPATCWCAVGAVYRSAYPHGSYRVYRALELLSDTVGCYHIGGWNDAPERTQAEVVAALRAAAEKARTANSVGTQPRSGEVRPNQTGDDQ